jgi:hypothetical protein
MLHNVTLYVTLLDTQQIDNQTFNSKCYKCYTFFLIQIQIHIYIIYKYIYKYIII